MQQIGSYLGSALLVVSLAAAIVPASAAAQSSACGLRTASAAPSMVVNGQTATAHFTVPNTCKSEQFSLVSYSAPSASGKPFNQQIIFQSDTQSFGPGRHSLTVGIPTCFFQVDLYTGPPVNLQTSVPIPAHPFALLAHANGGQACAAPAAAVTPTTSATTVNINQSQSQTQSQSVPAQAITSTATTPTTQSQSQVSAPAAAPLPQTGPEGALTALLGSGVVGSAVAYYRRSRQSLLDILRQ